MKIYVSGLYSGGNPQPGVGIIRSLRQAYPDATLVGVEYSNRVSGIHWNDLDDLWIQRPWDELDLESYGKRVKFGRPSDSSCRRMSADMRNP
jgi:carbamoyl-phosphate synthase large subunit